MADCIMVGCDLHDDSMLLMIAVDRDEPRQRRWGTTASSRRAMIRDLTRRAEREGAARIVFAYEACGFGFLLHDELTAAGIECHVLAPSKMKRSAKHRKRKTDARDARAILDALRAYVLAGVDLPAVWVPPLATRDDRELVRQRLSTAQVATAAKNRVRWLLKRNGVASPPGKAWTGSYWGWLEDVAKRVLRYGAGMTLASLMRHLEWLGEEQTRLDEQVEALSRTPRYAPMVGALCEWTGVGVLTAMVYLTELGDLSRFSNRRQVGSFLGLTPASFETGQDADRKGHITHEGPARVRQVLCQAVWSRVRFVPAEREAYERIVWRNPKHKKIAVVARMRMLAVRLWHAGLEAQAAMAAA